jgi:hypothetical protein
MQEADVDLARLFFQQSAGDLDAGRLQPGQTLPATSGLGSAMAATTRATPARMSASAQGGVRPKWLQGSSVT